VDAQLAVYNRVLDVGALTSRRTSVRFLGEIGGPSVLLSK